ncbi:hypothetical protein ANO14919_084420 [Xylariales sp. No.14919]|nr:hypothetical protein ANO14919_084420 [Xylariales sp. No.14919]
MSLTNLGPLPTNFAIASSCAKELDDVYKVYTSFDGWYYLLQGPVDQTSCYPSSYAANSKQYYSPARCPTGFTSACQSQNVAGTATETVLRCCPTHAKFECQTTASYGWEETLGCINPQDSSTTTVWTVTQVSSGLTALTTYTNVAGGINAYQIQVGFQSTDFASSTSTSRTTKAGAKPTSGTSTGGTSSNNNSSSSSKKKGRKGGISGGAIAGIVIGAIAGFLAVVGLIWSIIRRRRRQDQDPQHEEQAQEFLGTEKLDSIAPSQDFQDKGAPGNAAEPPQVVYEMAAPNNAVELDAGGVRPDMNAHRPASR